MLTYNEKLDGFEGDDDIDDDDETNTRASRRLREFINDIVTRQTPVPGLVEGKSILRIVETLYAKSGFPGLAPDA